MNTQTHTTSFSWEKYEQSKNSLYIIYYPGQRKMGKITDQKMKRYSVKWLVSLTKMLPNSGPLKQMSHAYIFLIAYFIVFLVCPTQQAQTCYQSDDIPSSNICNLCVSDNNTLISCKISWTCGTNCTRQSSVLSSTLCADDCCGLSYNVQPSFCPQNSGGYSLNLTVVLTIVFFVVPLCCCFIVIIVTCLRRRRNNQQQDRPQQPDPVISAVNLADYNIDQIGPYYLDGANSCAICLEDKTNLRTKCGHTYHPTCLKEWLKKKASCPVCVSKDVNPVKIYCSKCQISLKLAVLPSVQTTESAREWEDYNGILCQICKNPHQHQVLDISDCIVQQPNNISIQERVPPRQIKKSPSPAQKPESRETLVSSSHLNRQ